MTGQPQNPQEYWYIPVLKNKFPKPKFQLGQQVGIPWEDEFGNSCYDIGEIIGMQYIAQSNQPAQWYYCIRFLKSDRSPWLVGLNDDIFEAESRFVVDNTLIGD